MAQASSIDSPPLLPPPAPPPLLPLPAPVPPGLRGSTVEATSPPPPQDANDIITPPAMHDAVNRPTILISTNLPSMEGKR